MSDALFRALALSLPEVAEKSHFGKPDFRVRDKIFAGFNERAQAYVKLTPEQQGLLLLSEPKLISAIPGGWGKRGWTLVDQRTADEALISSALVMAYRNVAPKKLSTLIQRVGTGFSPR